VLRQWQLVAARVDVGSLYYVGLAVVVLILIIALISFFRTWTEIHEDDEPDSPEDLLESFRAAHAAGQIDDRELERLGHLLSNEGGQVTGGRRRERESRTASGFGLQEEGPTKAGPDGAES
jgi:hypothetical protein